MNMYVHLAFLFYYQQPPTPQSLSMEQQPSQPSLLGAAALSTGAHTVSPTQGSPSWPGTTPHGQQIPPDVIDQIEVLKQQLRVYADDFATEREDRERNQAEKEKLREELIAVKEQVQTLEQQVGFSYNTCYGFGSNFDVQQIRISN